MGRRFQSLPLSDNVVVLLTSVCLPSLPKILSLCTLGFSCRQCLCLRIHNSQAFKLRTLFLHTLAVLVQLAQNSSITLHPDNSKSGEECLVSIHIQRDTGGKE